MSWTKDVYSEASTSSAGLVKEKNLGSVVQLEIGTSEADSQVS